MCQDLKKEDEYTSCRTEDKRLECWTIRRKSRQTATQIIAQLFLPALLTCAERFSIYDRFVQLT